jgi:uncharacterized RDD family membrane protein YckC
MKCEKCGNEYPSQAYFTVPGICESCFKQLPQEEQTRLIEAAFDAQSFASVADGDKRVGFGRRLGAACIDGLILIVLYMVIYKFSGLWDAQMLLAERMQSVGIANAAAMQMMQNEFINQNLTSLLFIQVVYLLYFSLELFIGSTVGKLALGMQVGSANGTHAGFGALLKRFAFKYSSTVLGIIALLMSSVSAINYVNWAVSAIVIIGCFFALTKDKQAFHDKFAGTAVYRKSDLDADLD